MFESERINAPYMEYYRHIYHLSPRWDGKSSLKGKKVIVYCEQGFGDIIQFLRYLPNLEKHNCDIVLNCPKALHPIVSYDVIDKDGSTLPKHDYHILSLSLPFLLHSQMNNIPYIKYSHKADLEEHKNNVKIGIAWEGSLANPNNINRCCPLKYFKPLLGKDVSLFMLHNSINMPKLTEGVEFDIFGIPINDFGDTASLINALDFVVSVDTAILHLAGAMGVKTYGLLGSNPDPRWAISNWYDSVRLIRTNDWEDSINNVIIDLNS